MQHNSTKTTITTIMRAPGPPEDVVGGGVGTPVTGGGAGCHEGGAEGRDVGERDGGEGVALGGPVEGVGDVEGKAVGDVVGTAVGGVVGTAVGAIVGTAVGAIVVTGVEEVGAAVGAELGTCTAGGERVTALVIEARLPPFCLRSSKKVLPSYLF